jgi:hypothetical protein
MAIDGYIWFVLQVLIKFVGQEEEGHTGLWSQNYEIE